MAEKRRTPGIEGRDPPRARRRRPRPGVRRRLVPAVLPAPADRRGAAVPSRLRAGSWSEKASRGSVRTVPGPGGCGPARGVPRSKLTADDLQAERPPAETPPEGSIGLMSPITENLRSRYGGWALDTSGACQVPSRLLAACDSRARSKGQPRSTGLSHGRVLGSSSVRPSPAASVDSDRTPKAGVVSFRGTGKGPAQEGCVGFLAGWASCYTRTNDAWSRATTERLTVVGQAAVSVYAERGVRPHRHRWPGRS